MTDLPAYLAHELDQIGVAHLPPKPTKRHISLRAYPDTTGWKQAPSDETPW